MARGHDYEKSELANIIAEAIGVQRPTDYDTRSERRGVEDNLVSLFDDIKNRLSKFVDVSNASVHDIIATDIAYAISEGRKPIVDIKAVKEEKENLEKKYKLMEAKPTSGRRGSYGQKLKALNLVTLQIKPLNTVLNNYHKGNSLFYFESKIDQIQDSTDSGFIDSLSIIPLAYAQETISVPKIPNLSVYDITENSVMLSWSPNSSPITGFHLVIKNQDTGQTKYELDQGREGEMAVQGLDLATNYKAYIIAINEMGNSPEKSISFKTKGIIPSPVITPIEDTTIDQNMISQSIGAFKLENNRVKGSIIYIAESSFNPYYYNKPLTSIVSIKDQSGRTVKLKTNNLNFTATERDETINIDEEVGELDAIKIEFLVWKSVNDPIAFSKKKVDEVVAEEVGLAPCPLGQHRNFNGKCVPDDPIIGSSLLGKVMGVTAILGTLALLGSKGR